jgi:outer membrane immunogenic protein
VKASGSGSLKSNPLTFGVKVGNDWVSDKIVLGVVSDFSLFQRESTLNASGAYPSGSGNYSLRTVLDTDWLFTLRARAGLPIGTLGHSFFYVTAGLAAADLNLTSVFSDDTALGGSGTNELTGTQLGWTVGGGFEFAMGRNIYLSAEYLYVDFSASVSGSIDNSVAGFGTPAGSASNSFGSNADFHSHVARAGIVYRFNGADVEIVPEAKPVSETEAEAVNDEPASSPPPSNEARPQNKRSGVEGSLPARRPQSAPAARERRLHRRFTTERIQR